MGYTSILTYSAVIKTTYFLRHVLSYEQLTTCSSLDLVCNPDPLCVLVTIAVSCPLYTEVFSPS